MTELIELNESEQDAVIYYLIENVDFIKKCNRVRLKTEYFSSSVRQNIVNTIYRHHELYGAAIMDSIFEAISGSVFLRREEDKTDAIEYITNVLDKRFSAMEYYIEKIEEFCRDRVVITAVNDIMKIKDRVTATPDRLLEIMQSACSKVVANSFSSRVELLSEDPLYDFDRNVITKFMIPEIDNPMGGGLQVGAFLVLLAYTGIGKSWGAGHLCKIANTMGNSALYIPTEMANRTARLRWKMQCSGIEAENIQLRSGEVRQAIRLTGRGGSETYLITEEEKDLSIEDLPNLVDEVQEKFNKEIKLIVFDSLDETSPPKDSLKFSKIEQSTAKYVYFKNYLKDSDIAGVTTTQAQRRGETARWMKASFVGDDINKIRKATLGVSLNQSITGEEDCDLMRVFLFKNTDGPVGSKCWVKRNLSQGQFVIDSGRYTELDDYKNSILYTQPEYED